MLSISATNDTGGHEITKRVEYAKSKPSSS